MCARDLLTLRKHSKPYNPNQTVLTLTRLLEEVHSSTKKTSFDLLVALIKPVNSVFPTHPSLVHPAVASNRLPFREFIDG